MLPMRRLELHLAQIAMLIAQSRGGAADATLADFLFDRPAAADRDDGSGETASAEQAQAFFGFNPIK